MSNAECFYCTEDKTLQSRMVKVCVLQKSTLYLNLDQTLPGRCIVALNDHKGELFELTPSELQGFMEDVSHGARAIQKAFNADKINYAVYGDLISHLHFHIVPKYQNKNQWGEAFINNPEQISTISSELLNKRIDLITENLDF